MRSLSATIFVALLLYSKLNKLYIVYYSLNSYGYQPSEYVGAGEVPYGAEGMAFGPTGPSLEAAPAETRATPPGSDHTSGEREYKFSTEEERHSPCEESNLPPRSPNQ